MRDCDCVPGHRCDCWDFRGFEPDHFHKLNAEFEAEDYRAALLAILTNAEYAKMEAEGKAADLLGLTWDENSDRYVESPPASQKR